MNFLNTLSIVESSCVLSYHVQPSMLSLNCDHACITYIDINSYYASVKDPLVTVTCNGYHDNVDL